MADDSSVPYYLQPNSSVNDPTSQPVDLSSMGLPSGPGSIFTPGINQTYPNQNQPPAVSDNSSSSNPGFFGSILSSVENAGKAVVNEVEAAPSQVYSAGKTVLNAGENAVVGTYDAAKSAVGTVASDVGGGVSGLLGGIESHLFIILGIVVAGGAILLWSAGKSGAVHANVNAIV